jgi:hydroxyacylglutathione hydrolase
MILEVPAFQDNYIWIITDHAQRCAAVVDPGDASPVIAALDAKGLELRAILITHHHADHSGGIDALVDHAGNRDPAYLMPVYGPAGEAIAGVNRPLADGDRVEIPECDMELAVMSVPGHTLGHIAYAGRAGGEGPVLFCGDTMFAAGCGRLFEGSPEQMWSSLSRLAALPPETAVYCAHEYTLSNLRFAAHVLPGDAPISARLRQVIDMRERGMSTVPSRIGVEIDTNPFLRCRNAEEFALMRSRKDSFRG